MTAPADPVVVHGNHLCGAKGRSRSPFNATAPPWRAAGVKCRTAAVDGAYDMVAVWKSDLVGSDQLGGGLTLTGQMPSDDPAVYVARDNEELRPWRERLATRHGRLVASVALYGGCGQSLGDPVIIPLLALLGGRDDWTPAAPCVALANAQANGMMQFQLYPEAYHAFDAASGIEKPHTAYGHLVAYDPSATADAHKRVPEFLYRYLR